MLPLNLAFALWFFSFGTTKVWAEEALTLETAKAATANGDVKAEYFLARQYAKGTGVLQDYEQSATWMRRAAEKGYPMAQNDLGAYYAKGLGVKQDLRSAFHWYQLAAESGDSLAQYSLGRAYFDGRGVPTNITESLKWYGKAAEQKQPEAMLALGYIYLNGAPGVPTDCQAARVWFDRAAAHGKVGALNPLGFIFEHGGSGITPDLNRAAKCYREAAEKNDAEGQMNLGRMYLDGSGVKRDLIEAYQWFYLAYQNGNGVANRYLRDLGNETAVREPLLTSAQVAEAVRRADQFQESFRLKK